MRRDPLLLALALVGCALTLRAAAQVRAAQPPPRADPAGGLSFDQIFADETQHGFPRSLVWSPAGDRLAYLYDDGPGEGLWVLTPGRGEPVLLVRRAKGESEDGAGEASEADTETLATNEQDPTPGRIEDFTWSPDGSRLVLVSRDDLWLVPAAGGGARRLTATAAAEEAPGFSPDGKTLAFVRDADLHLIDLASGTVRDLTDDGVDDEILNGTTDWVYWEEIWNRDATGYWWSPDGTKIAYYRFEEEPVGVYPLVDFTHVPYPALKWQKYPKAGTDNPRVRVGVLDLVSGETTWMDTGDDASAYLARVAWRPDGARLAIQRLNRDQTRLDLLACDPAAGGCDLLLQETWPTWVNLGDDFRFLADGRFVWGSERTGWRHLYLYAADGSLLRPLTTGDWAVTSLDAVDEPRGRALFTSFGSGELAAAQRRVAAVSLAEKAPADGGITILTEGAGWHGAVAADTGRWVHTWSDSETPPRAEVLDAAGGKLAELPSRAPGFDPASLPHWRYFTLDGEGGVTLPARILEPLGAPGSAPTGQGLVARRPALMYHYGGPASQVVANRWGGTGDLWHKMMTQRSYTVLAVDNPASTFFGKRGEDRQHRRFGPINLAAQQRGAAYLASLPGVDGSRIGLWGWSGGGANTLYCLLNSPGTWAAGMAGAPVTDWRLYDTIWTERYLDTPEDNPDGYRDSSPLTYAGQLADRLLVVHGTADDNVHPQNTLALASALIKAGKPFEDALYPRQKHGFRTPSDRHFYERMTRFFAEALAPRPQ